MAVYGLLGGTFDPVHLGHLVLAESARETFRLDKVFFVPAGNPPHKPGQVMAAATDRLRMVKIAIAGNPHFIVSPIELERSGPSYTIDTVAALRADTPGLNWGLIVGSDTLQEISTWRNYQDLIPQVWLLAAARPGTPLTMPPDLSPWADRIKFFAPPSLDISATMLRDRIYRGLSLRYLVPEGVAHYIAERRIYIAEGQKGRREEVNG